MQTTFIPKGNQEPNYIGKEKNSLQIFSNTEFGKIRFVDVEGLPHAVGVDVARALGYPYPSHAVIDHCKGMVKMSIPSYNQHGAEVIQETNVIPEGDIYRLIIKAADQSRNEAIKEKAGRFEKWLFDEVLPTYRKHGFYASENVVENWISNPDSMIQVLQAYRDERGKTTRLLQEVAENAPKVLFAQSVEASKSEILVGELAKILKQNGVDTGQNRLFETLRKEGYLISRKGTDWNMPTQRSMEQGLMRIKETTITHADGHISISKTPKVTGKGQVYFINRYRNMK
ncbi:MAG: phage repressor protein/antirepressor Ant [Clostridiales bacterium]|nr:phage repressor protein/antirepressor Ant [Clostridiales bacterium]